MILSLNDGTIVSRSSRVVIDPFRTIKAWKRDCCSDWGGETIFFFFFSDLGATRRLECMVDDGVFEVGGGDDLEDEGWDVDWSEEGEIVWLASWLVILKNGSTASLWIKIVLAIK